MAELPTKRTRSCVVQYPPPPSPSQPKLPLTLTPPFSQVRATLPNRPTGGTLPPLPSGVDIPGSLVSDLSCLPPRMSVSVFGCCLAWAVDWGTCFSKFPPVSCALHVGLIVGPAVTACDRRATGAVRVCVGVRSWRQTLKHCGSWLQGRPTVVACLHPRACTLPLMVVLLYIVVAVRCYVRCW